MSGGGACHCAEGKKPLAERPWRVVQRKCNHSAFNGYHYTPSQYSSLTCLACLCRWRSKGKFIDQLKDD